MRAASFLVGAALAATAALALSACAATGERIVKTYEDRAAGAAPYARILVVGAHAQTGTRRTFEDSVVRSLAALGADARSSLAVMGEEQAIDRESVVAAVRASPGFLNQESPATRSIRPSASRSAAPPPAHVV